jgi:hypothetical protein
MITISYKEIAEIHDGPIMIVIVIIADATAVLTSADQYRPPT